MTKSRYQRPKRLIIVTGAENHVWDNAIWAYGPYSKEIDILAPLFEKIIILAPIFNTPPPKTHLKFKTTYISTIKLPRIGGHTFWHKALALFLMPIGILKLIAITRRTDIVMPRCPDSYGLMASIVAPLLTKYRIAKYAGQWNGYPHERFTVRLQRAVLRSKWWNSPVTVYGEWPDQPTHVFPFFTSMMSSSEMNTATTVLQEKLTKQWFLRHDKRPFRILFSGRLAPEKHIDQLLLALAELREKKLRFECRIVGTGSLEQNLKSQVKNLGIDSLVEFIGGLPYTECLAQNAWADCLVLPSKDSEGWPKVIAEAMAYGLICIGVDFGQVTNMLSNGGICLKEGSAHEISQAISNIAKKPEGFLDHRLSSSKWSSQYTIEHLRDKNAQTMDAWWSKIKA